MNLSQNLMVSNSVPTRFILSLQFTFYFISSGSYSVCFVFAQAKSLYVPYVERDEEEKRQTIYLFKLKVLEH